MLIQLTGSLADLEINNMKLAIKRTDGGLSIMNLIADAEGNFPDIEKTVKQWEVGSLFKAESWQEITDFPDDRTFRDAWHHDGEKITVNMDKARDIHMQRIRFSRNEKLKELDVETFRGKNVQAEKQVLRDLPQTFDLTKAKNPEELKALWPDNL